MANIASCYYMAHWLILSYLGPGLKRFRSPWWDNKLLSVLNRGRWFSELLTHRVKMQFICSFPVTPPITSKKYFWATNRKDKWRVETEWRELGIGKFGFVFNLVCFQICYCAGWNEIKWLLTVNNVLQKSQTETKYGRKENKLGSSW